MGISGICNLVAAIKTAKYYDMDGRDVIFTCLTDSAGLYGSRLEELAAEHGPYSRRARRLRPGPLPRRHRHRSRPRAYLLRPQGAPQLQILHLGRAARPHGRRTPRAVESRLLAANIRPSRRMGRPNRRFQRPHRRARFTLSTDFFFNHEGHEEHKEEVENVILQTTGSLFFTIH